MFLDGDSDDDQHMNGGVKKVKIGKQNGMLFVSKLFANNCKSISFCMVENGTISLITF